MRKLTSPSKPDLCGAGKRRSESKKRIAQSATPTSRQGEQAKGLIKSRKGKDKDSKKKPSLRPRKASSRSGAKADREERRKASSAPSS